MSASRSIVSGAVLFRRDALPRSCPERSGPSYGFNGSAARRPPLPAAREGVRQPNSSACHLFIQVAQSNPSY